MQLIEKDKKNQWKLRKMKRLILNLFLLTAWIITIPVLESKAEVPSTSIHAERKLWLSIVLKSQVSAPPARSNPSEWTQDAHDAQRTGYTLEEPLEPWSLIWTWNGPDSKGSPGNHFYNAPREARTITGGRYVYVPAGSAGLFALNKSDGSQGWHLTNTSFNATPAYDSSTQHLYAGGADGTLYKIDTNTGSVVQTYTAGNPLNKSVLLADESVYIVTDSGEMHKISKRDMSQVWKYSAGSSVATPPAYSAAKDVIVYATDDLYVHAVRGSDGMQKWRIKPTGHPARDPFTYEGYWPVIAEQHGIVFLRMNLGMDMLWSGPRNGEWGGGIYPTSLNETRALLIANSGALKNLFALNLDDGSESFVPAVGYGGVEGLMDGKPVLMTGPIPVIKVFSDGTEVAYTPFRNGQGNPKDGRWDSHMGEMVLDSNTISGLAAGDLRFVQFDNSYTHISDEQTPLTMAGDSLFNAHWGASEGVRIQDRGSDRGKTFDNPIKSNPYPVVIRRIQACPNFDAATHWTTCGLTLYDDGRYWKGPGWWIYWNVLDPPTASRNAYSQGILPRYTYVSDGLVIVEGNGGELFVLSHSGP